MTRQKCITASSKEAWCRNDDLIDDLLAACEAAYEHLGAPYQVARDDKVCGILLAAIAKAGGGSE
jgi:hypothetical protein